MKPIRLHYRVGCQSNYILRLIELNIKAGIECHVMDNYLRRLHYIFFNVGIVRQLGSILNV